VHKGMKQRNAKAKRNNVQTAKAHIARGPMNAQTASERGSKGKH